MLIVQKHFFVFLSVLSFTSSIDFLKLNEDNNDIREVSQCIVDIIRKNDFYQPTLVILCNEYQNNTSYIHIQEKIMATAVQNDIPIMFISTNVYSNEINAIHNGSLIIVHYIESCKELIEFTKIDIDRHIKYIIILVEQIKDYCNDELQQTATLVAIFDVTFIYKNSESSVFKLATFIPILNPKTCKPEEQMKLIDMGTCRHGAITDGIVNLFPDKQPKNLMGCPLKVGMGSLYPYVKIRNGTDFQNLDPLTDIQGSDIEIMKIVANYFNASLQLYHIKIVVENVLLDLSFMPFLLNGTLEICAGGLYRVFGDVVSYSGIYSRQAVIWVYTVERENASWLAFIEQTDGIHIFLIFYLCYSVIWTLISYFDGNAVSFVKTLIYSWGTLLGATSLQDARTFKQKVLNCFYLVLCIHLSAYVSIQLFAFLSIKWPPYVYKDTDDLAHSQRPIYLKDTAKYFIEDEKYISFANTSDDCNGFWDCITKSIKNKGATIIIDGIFAQVQTTTAVGDEATVLKAKGDVLVVYHEMLIRKESTLVDGFENVITRLFEAGICERLYEESIGILVIDKARRANQNMMSKIYSCEVGCTITLSQFAGAFYFWMFGCVLSCFIFCVELLLKKEWKF